jgi:hypothetical protein
MENIEITTLYSPDSTSDRIPPELLRYPEELNIPPVVTKPTELPFNQLTWQNFERLLYQLAKSANEVEHCMLYGREGQGQKGIDIYSRVGGGKYHCWQAKNHKKYSASKVKKAVDDFMAGDWAKRSTRFVLCVSAGLDDTKVQDEIETQCKRLQAEGIELLSYDGLELSDKLREHPRIIDNFFGRDWLEAFLGKDVADSLRRKVQAWRVCELLNSLGAIYYARFSLLDPGLTPHTDKVSSSDVRQRFVSVDIDESDPYQSQMIEDVDYREPARSDKSSALEEPSPFRDMEAGIELNKESFPKSSRSPVEDWLLNNKRSLLIGEAGSGKSTILRCIALDFVKRPVVFGRLVERLLPRIPILVSFSQWTRMTEKCGREVHLSEVIKEGYRAQFPEDDMQTSFIDSLLDERLLLLVDGLDEYSNEQAARTALMTLDTFIATNDVYAIATARPAGYKRIGPLSSKWRVGGIAGLSIEQQRKLAEKYLRTGLEDAGDNAQAATINIQVDNFLSQIERAGNINTLAATPLLLQSLFAVSIKNAILPSTKFELFEQMISLLLVEHPKRRATAASETAPRESVFAEDSLRLEVLSRLAYRIQLGAYDSGITKSEAKKIIIEYLVDPNTCAWNRNDATRAAKELIDIDANTTGLIAERGPDEIAFFHAAFREHLAGFEISRWELEQQIKFGCENSDNPRWRGALLSLFKFLPRNTDVSKIINAIKDGCIGEHNTVERRLLLAEAAFSCSSKIGGLGAEITTTALDSVETGSNVGERYGLLELALDGPRTGPIGELISSRLESWWPCSYGWMISVYPELGQWDADLDIERILIRGMFDDSADNRFAASALLSKRYGGQQSTEENLVSILNSNSSDGVIAAVLNALIMGWPDALSSTDWIDESLYSRSSEIRAVAFLAKFEQGWRDEESLEALLEQLDRNWGRIPSYLSQRLEDCLVEAWSGDRRVQNICWASVHRRGPSDYHLDYDVAQHILLRIHSKDERVGEWIAEEFRLKGRGMHIHGMRDNEAYLAEAINSNSDAKQAVDAWFCDPGDRIRYDYNAARLAAFYKSDAAKSAMLALFEDKKKRLDFWPVWSLLTGWGMQDLEVSEVLKAQLDRPLEELQHIAEYLPAIIENNDDCFRKLMDICALEELIRPDFVIRGFAAIECSPNDSAVVDAILHHVPAKVGINTGVSDLIQHFYEDPRVRQFALDQFQQRDEPLNVIAKVYKHDPEFRKLVLNRCAPLPSALRRVIAKRASQRLDDPALNRVLETCDIEEDPTAKSEATIGLAKKCLTDPARRESFAEKLAEQLTAVGPDLDERRCAAFGGLVALGRLDLFQDKIEPPEKRPLQIDLSSPYKDMSPVVDITATNWIKVEPSLGDMGIGRFNRWSDSKGSVVWDTFTPYLGRSNRLRKQFLEFCESTDKQVSSAILLALAKELPRSDLLKEHCHLILKAEEDNKQTSPLDHEHACLAASICISEYFRGDTDSLPLLDQAITKSRRSTALVGLAKGWPEHELLKENWAIVKDPEKNHRIGWTSFMWLASTLGAEEEFVNSVANFAVRIRRSPWDFPLETLNAVNKRIENDESVLNHLKEILEKTDSASIRASLSLLLHQSKVTDQEIHLFLKEIYEKERTDYHCKRFGLDITTNRIRRLEDVFQKIL